MTGSGFPTRDLLLVERHNQAGLDDIRACIAANADPDFIADAIIAHVNSLNEFRAELGLLSRCAACHKPIVNAPVFDDDEQAWRANTPEQWRRWCSVGCRDGAAERYWAGKWTA